MKCIIFILLFITSFAEAQFISTPQRVGQRPADLDSIKAAVSMRLIKSSYTGACVKVRRSSDNAEQDIGFVGEEFDVAAFNTFVGGGSGYVTTWYDQSGLAHHATQTATANQPQVILNHKNGHSSIYFDGTDYFTLVGSNSTYSFNYLHTTQGTIMAVWQPGTASNPDAVYNLLGSNGGTSSKSGIYIAYDDRVSVPLNNTTTYTGCKATGSSQFTFVSTVQNIMLPNQYHQCFYLLDPGNAILQPFAKSRHYLNGADIKPTLASGSIVAAAATNATHEMQLGSNGFNSGFLVGYIAEIVIYGGWISGTDQVSITTNTNNYWATFDYQWDIDANTYFSRVATAGYTLTDAQKVAVNKYIVALKDANLWPKIIDRGLPIWGTSAPSLISFRNHAILTAVNSPTFSFSGVDFNGTNQYLSTAGTIANTYLGLNDAHISFYSGEHTTTNCIDMACYNTAASQNFHIQVIGTTDRIGRIWYGATAQLSGTAVGSNAGYISASRTSATDLRLYWNGLQIGVTQTGTVGTRPTNNFFIGARNATTIDGYCDRQCRMWSFGRGFTVTESEIDNQLTERLMDDLGIGVQP